MEVGLFLLGALGALLTVYLAKQEVIPEFRPLFDTFEKEKEAKEHQDHIKKTEKHIDRIQAKLEEGALQETLNSLKASLESSQVELRDERARLEMLEKEIKQSQIISRGLGFLFYIVLGGVFGSLLAGKVKVEGLSGDLPTYFQSMVIGATWITYLSAVGVRLGRDKADDKIGATLKEAYKKIDDIKKEVMEIVLKEVAKAEKAQKVAKSKRADEVAKIVGEKLDMATEEVQSDLNLTRTMVQRDMRGLL